MHYYYFDFQILYRVTGRNVYTNKDSPQSNS